ncbi:MAG: ubiquitin-like domain-containing protein [Candidatus Hodarchaeota archaeon]
MSDDFEDLGNDFQEEPVVKSKTPAASKTPSGMGPSGPKVNLFFKSTVGPGERTEKMIVGKNATVGDLKYTLGNVFGLDPNDFHLSSAGRTMDENDKVGNYDVSDGDEILLIPHSTAGRAAIR